MKKQIIQSALRLLKLNPLFLFILVCLPIGFIFYFTPAEDFLVFKKLFSSLGWIIYFFWIFLDNLFFLDFCYRTPSDRKGGFTKYCMGWIPVFYSGICCECHTFYSDVIYNYKRKNPNRTFAG